ncbi:MAG: DUF2892 domain-containing protein [Bacteroidales bacterium]|jgi:hypothetical protein|nr:DUF2892 domain-containing protein [Bacteroidales bacterium]
MQCNIGKTDKTIRIIVGIIIGGAGLYFNNWWGLLGLIPIITAVSGFCPAYLPCKLSTAKDKSNEAN